MNILTALEHVIKQTEQIKNERDSFIYDAEFFAIRDLLFEAISEPEVWTTEGAVVTMDLGSAAQIVEYIERSEELINGMTLQMLAQAYMTIMPGHIAHEQFGAFNG